jgi:hypothetical protein
MREKRNIALVSLAINASLPLWAGTGRPSDGLLSFLLLLGFLLLILGILHLVGHVKSKIRNILEGLY